MDHALRNLERRAFAGNDLTLLEQYFHTLQRSYEDPEPFMRLRNFALQLIPEDIRVEDMDRVLDTVNQDPYLAHCVDFARKISKHLWHNLKHDFFRNRPFTRWDYKNPPPGFSSWAVVEFDETYTLVNPNQIVSLTGVYLLDTAANTYIASLTPSIAISGLYPNIIDVLHHTNFDDIEEDWYSAAVEMDYINKRDLARAIDWYWVPAEEVTWCADEYPEAILDCLRENYLSNHVL
jgi:hypothetical protein